MKALSFHCIYVSNDLIAGLGPAGIVNENNLRVCRALRKPKISDYGE